MKQLGFLHGTLVAGVIVAALGAFAGCGQSETGYCFPDGNCDTTATAGSAGSAGKGTGGSNMGQGGSLNLGGMAGTDGAGGNIIGGVGGMAGAAGSSCVKTATADLCNDKIDNDCDGMVDNVDFTKPATCGNCTTDCLKQVQNGSKVKCGASAKPGTDPGKCDYTECAPNFYDVDGKRENGCEYGPCKKTGTTDIPCDGLDNDCNGIVDDGVDLCSTERCGDCSVNCSKKFPHATGTCEKADPKQTSCQLSTASCKLEKCADGFFDANKDPKDGCEYQCSPTGPELCGDGIDNDCDGLVDTADPSVVDDPQLGKPCTVSDVGVCGKKAGTLGCVGNVVACVGAPKPGELPEICNGEDDDCNGQIDDNLTDLTACGDFSFGKCKKGQNTCNNGVPECIGAIPPEANEFCNNVDDDCDDIIDGTAPGGALVDCVDDTGCAAGQVCRPRSSDPTKKACALPTQGEGLPCGGSTSMFPNPCGPGKQVCANATLSCVGAVISTIPDKCGEDTNCNGVLENQPDVMTDPENCGMCGNSCNNGVDHINYTCVNGACQLPADPKAKCQLGFVDCDGNVNDCEKACTFLSTQEICNGIDDNCDCNIDEVKDATHPNGIQVPTPDQACGVLPGAAADPGCAAKTPGNPGGVEVLCQAGKFTCNFQGGRCNGGNCASTPDLCDGIDNNCNGVIDDPFKAPVKTTDAVGAPCASDDGKADPGDGECRAKGTYACSADGKSTTCAVKGKPLKCGVMAGDDTFNQKPCEELCDGKDNDCDGVVDEPKFDDKGPAPGADTGSYMKPAVVKIGNSLWIHQYEVSRPNGTGTSSGSGNGYWGDPGTPGGVTIDKTPACNDAPSANNPARVPWFNTTPFEVEQTCKHMGGRICKLSEWQSACKVNQAPSGTPTQDCTWGYGSACKTPKATTCNLLAYDFDPGKGGNQDGLLPVASSGVSSCFANWTSFNTSGTGANPAGNVGLFDITGNLREITVIDSTAGMSLPQKQYALMGGAFNSEEEGATCDFSFYTVDYQFQLFSVGFRCCFDQYPD
jgi:hypothetical protein